MYGLFVILSIEKQQCVIFFINRRGRYTHTNNYIGRVGQGRRQGKSLEGAKLPRESRGRSPLVGVRG